MEDHSLQFFKRLLSTPGPSGDEATVARIWREEASGFADEVRADVHGSSFAVLNGGSPRVLLGGHIDEIGFMVSHIDDEGYLWISSIGGWDPQVLVGQRARLLGVQGEVIGAIGKKPIHLMDGDDREKASKVKDLWIDIGVNSRDEAAALVQVGTVGVLDAPVYDLPNGRLISRSLDNRVGSFIVLETLRQLAADRPAVTVGAVVTSREEIHTSAAASAAFSFDPQVCIAVDVTYATDHPDSDKKQYGDVKLGSGAVLSRGSANSAVVYQMLVDIAEREKIPYALQITPSYTGTDADKIFNVRGGIASAIISVPNRYMHSPNEMIQLSDVDDIVRLMVAFVRSLTAETDFIPR